MTSSATYSGENVPLNNGNNNRSYVLPLDVTQYITRLVVTASGPGIDSDPEHPDQRRGGYRDTRAGNAGLCRDRRICFWPATGCEVAAAYAPEPRLDPPACWTRASSPGNLHGRRRRGDKPGSAEYCLPLSVPFHPQHGGPGTLLLARGVGPQVLTLAGRVIDDCVGQLDSSTTPSPEPRSPRIANAHLLRFWYSGHFWPHPPPSLTRFSPLFKPIAARHEPFSRLTQPGLLRNRSTRWIGRCVASLQHLVSCDSHGLSLIARPI